MSYKVNQLKNNVNQMENSKESLGLAGSNLLAAFELFGLCGLISIAGFTYEIYVKRISWEVSYLCQIKLIFLKNRIVVIQI